MYKVLIVNAQGVTSFKPDMLPGQEIPEHFRHYGDANRWAIEHASIEAGHITYVVREDLPDVVLVAYQSLSELKHGRVAMLDCACAEHPDKLPELGRQQIAWFTRHYAKQAS